MPLSASAIPSSSPSLQFPNTKVVEAAVGEAVGVEEGVAQVIVVVVVTARGDGDGRCCCCGEVCWVTEDGEEEDDEEDGEEVEVVGEEDDDEEVGLTRELPLLMVPLPSLLLPVSVIPPLLLICGKVIICKTQKG